MDRIPIVVHIGIIVAITTIALGCTGESQLDISWRILRANLVNGKANCFPIFMRFNDGCGELLSDRQFAFAENRYTKS